MTDLPVEQEIANLIRQSIFLLHNNPRLKIAELSDQLEISERQLRRLFQRRFGCTPIRYRLYLRLEGAAAQIRRDQYQKFSDVAADWGFADQAHFTNCFKNYFGITPTVFAEETGSEDDGLIHSADRVRIGFDSVQTSQKYSGDPSPDSVH